MFILLQNVYKKRGMGCKSSSPSKENGQRWTTHVLSKRLTNISDQDIENIRTVWAIAGDQNLALMLVVEMFRNVLSAYPQTISHIPSSSVKSRFTYDWKWYADNNFISFAKNIIKWVDDFIGSLDKGKDLINYKLDVLCNINSVNPIGNPNPYKVGFEGLESAMNDLIPTYAKSPQLQESWRMLLKALYHALTIQTETPHSRWLRR